MRLILKHLTILLFIIDNINSKDDYDYMKIIYQVEKTKKYKNHYGGQETGVNQVALI